MRYKKIFLRSLNAKPFAFIASQWSHEKLFPSFHRDEGAEDYEYDEIYKRETENWRWREFPSITMGNCYMFEYTKNVSPRSASSETQIWIK